MSPVNPVWGFTRLITPTQSASAAYRSSQIGQPQRLAHLDHVHRGADRAAHGRLGHAVVLEDRALALGRPAAMAPHRGDDEGVRAQRLQVVHGRADDRVDVDDAPAPDGQGHGLARLHRQREPAERRPHRDGHVLDGGPVERLLHPDHPREASRRAECR